MKHLIMGTAGHVDHGKTTLIKALTGYDCDTHPEEKQRGITIHLGFSHLNVSDELEIGIIDVPGHKDFINTMISGANAFDLVLLLISADSGIMPQTREHFQIIKLLNIKHGIIVINKIDLVDKETLEILHSEIADFSKGTELESFPVVDVSAKNGIGIPNLLKAIEELSYKIESKSVDDIFRMYIDRVFQVKGFGTVVTGSVLSGILTKSTNLYMLPDKNEVKIRRIERHSQETDTIQAGDRASINIQNPNDYNIQKGMMLSSLPYASTSIIDARLDLYETNQTLNIWSQCIFISGTQELQAKIHLLDRNSLQNNESALVQIHLEKSTPLCLNDKFIIRNSSAESTLGGGIVIDAHPLHHRRRTEKLLVKLNKIKEGRITDLYQEEIFKSKYPVSNSDIQFSLALSTNKMNEIDISDFDDQIVHFKYKEEIYFWQKSQTERYITRSLRNLQVWHKNNIYDPLGKTFEELSGLITEYPISYRYPAIFYILECLKNQGLVEKRVNTYALKTHKVLFSVETNKALQWTENYIKFSGMKTPLWSEMSHKAKYQNIDEKTLKQLCTYLYRKQKVYYIEESYLYYKIVDDCRLKLLNYLIEHPEGITVAQFRDLINGNRKIALLLLAIFDIEAIVYRIDDNRVITEKGRQQIKDY